LLSRLRSRGDNNLYLLDLASNKDSLLTEHKGIAEFFGLITPDGNAAYIATNKDRDLAAFARIRLDAAGTTGPMEILAERSDAEVDGMKLNKQGTVAVLRWNVKGRSELSFYDLVKNRQLPAPKLPGELTSAGVFSPDGKKVAFSVSGSAQPADIWILDLNSNQFRQLTFSPRPGIDMASLVRPELVTFPAHDGLELSGWLYRPSNQTGPGAYVISFHGGPEGQERPGFRNDYQALLSQGIGVFAPNVRGSAGFGKRFVNVEYGDPVKQKQMLDSLSPIYKLDRIKAATMVQHGANDTNVPVVEAEQIAKNLKQRGVPVEYILFPDEGHGWRKIPNRIRSISEMVRFFKAHLGPS
jgi:dipeptidyl aminopeptidase/acylaminoacyl peptidase